MKRFQKAAYLLIFLSVAAVAAGMLFKWTWPFGVRSCYLPCMLKALQMYSPDHAGQFPNNEQGNSDSLIALYPKYMPNAEFLAGLSGPRSEVRAILENSRGSIKQHTSWVYISGLEDGFQYSDCAILWDQKPNLLFNGRRASTKGHAVGFAGGHHEFIPASLWENFLQTQAVHRASLLKKRKDAPTRVE
jgi:hypothetical protein